MKQKLVRLAIGVPAAFNALSAIGGGIALLLGTYKDGVLIEAGGNAQFPLEWLQHTPFSDYSIPALILTIGVGGSSLIAAALLFTGRDEGILASVVAGLIMAGFIVGEVVMLKQGISLIEGLYFGLGLLNGVVQWVRNLRAAGTATLTRGRHAEEISVTELPEQEAAPVLKQYLLKVAAVRPYFDATVDSPLESFEREALRHPVFHITPMESP
jgi:hypothetical protein